MTDTAFPQWTDFPMANAPHVEEAEALGRYIGSLVAVWNLPGNISFGPRNLPTDLFNETPTTVGILQKVHPYHSYVQLFMKDSAGTNGTYYSDICAWQILHYGGQR